VEDLLDGGNAGEALLAVLTVLVQQAPPHLLNALIGGPEARVGRHIRGRAVPSRAKGQLLGLHRNVVNSQLLALLQRLSG